MKKIFFIFAMLLMSVVSVWAEELSETISMTTRYKTIYTGSHFTIEGEAYKNKGLLISDDNRITITANDGERITKVIFYSGTGDIENVQATKGEYEYVTDHTINGVNDTSFQIYTEGVTENLAINEVTIYYEVNDAPPVDGDVQTVSFIPKSGLNFSKENIIVTGTYTDGDNSGLRIDNGKSVTIASNNGVMIQKVDMHFAYYLPDTDKKIISTVGNVSGRDHDWSIDNVNSTSLTISHPGVGRDYEVEIDNIVVYYIVPYTFEVAARKADVSYWATFYSSIANYQAPDDTKVFKVNFDGSSITMTEIEDRIVTKGQGVVLKTNSTSNLNTVNNTVNIVMTKTDGESLDSYSGNSLKGTDIAISNPGNAYVLNYKPLEGLGFYRLSSTATIPANRAYLTSGATVAGATAAAREFFAFDAAITGIDNVNAQDSEDDVKTFDLQGRRVTNPAKGVYIVNGKKVIMK